ncbi:MAG: hypothetical protein PWQ74_728 [Methanobacteriaceae archaeon]|nr:hypothetical protein [Methanobacteriaceae archaeon]
MKVNLLPQLPRKAVQVREVLQARKKVVQDPLQAGIIYVLLVAEVERSSKNIITRMSMEIFTMRSIIIYVLLVAELGIYMLRSSHILLIEC